MRKIRLDRVEVTANQPEATASTYGRNFGLQVSPSADGGFSVAVGDCEIKIRPQSVKDSKGQGLAGLWLEVDNVDEVISALESAGFPTGSVQVREGRRVLAVDSKLSNQAPLFIFDRRV